VAQYLHLGEENHWYDKILVYVAQYLHLGEENHWHDKILVYVAQYLHLGEENHCHDKILVYVAQYLHLGEENHWHDGRGGVSDGFGFGQLAQHVVLVRHRGHCQRAAYYYP